MSTEIIKSVKRVFEVLEYFEEVCKPLSLNDIATHFRYPTSSTAAMLKSMMLLGYLNYDAKGRTYMPTLRLAELGAWAQAAFLHEDHLLSAIRELSARTGETVSVGMQSDIYAQYLHVAYPEDEVLQFRVKAGTLRLLTSSGFGWLLLSAYDDSQVELLWRRVNRKKPAGSPAIPLSQLMARVQEARAQGFIVSRHTVTQGAGVIGMLLPERYFGRTLAIGVGGPVWRMDQKYDLIIKELAATVADFSSVQDPRVRSVRPSTI